MRKNVHFYHHPVRSLLYAVSIFLLFLIATPMMVTQTQSLPVFNNFNNWRNQPLPSGNPIRVQYLLDGTYYNETVDVLVFKLQQFEETRSIYP